MKFVRALTVQLVPVQMLSARVALPTALVRALKLLVESLSASPPLSAATCTLVALAFTVVASVATAAAALTTVGRCRRGRLSLASARLHLVGELSLDLAQVRRVPCMH